MFKPLLSAALRGMAQQLAINPRDVRLLLTLDGEESLLAKIDGATLADLLNRQADSRYLRIKIGQLAFDFELGARAGSRRPIKQRGSSR